MVSMRAVMLNLLSIIVMRYVNHQLAIYILCCMYYCMQRFLRCYRSSLFSLLLASTCCVYILSVVVGLSMYGLTLYVCVATNDDDE